MTPVFVVEGLDSSGGKVDEGLSLSAVEGLACEDVVGSDFGEAAESVVAVGSVLELGEASGSVVGVDAISSALGFLGKLVFSGFEGVAGVAPGWILVLK